MAHTPQNRIAGGVPGRYWHVLDDGRVQCDLCPRFCRLREGQRGLCFVRGRTGDEIVLTTYGRSSGFCIDPIEKKPLNHFLPGTPVLSFGTAGCNLACRFCQNWDISKSRELDRLQARASPRAIAEAAGVSELDLLEESPAVPSREEARLAHAREICARYPDADFHNVWHTLTLLERPPLERLLGSLRRGRG